MRDAIPETPAGWYALPMDSPRTATAAPAAETPGDEPAARRPADEAKSPAKATPAPAEPLSPSSRIDKALEGSDDDSEWSEGDLDAVKDLNLWV